MGGRLLLIIGALDAWGDGREELVGDGAGTGGLLLQVVGRTEEDDRAFLKNNRRELTPEEIEMVNGGGLFDFIKKIGESIADAVSEIFD